MHIRLIETGETPRRVSFDVAENMESVTRWIIDGVLPHTASQIASIRFIPIRAELLDFAGGGRLCNRDTPAPMRAELFDFAGTVLARLDCVTSRELREKLALLYPELK